MARTLPPSRTTGSTVRQVMPDQGAVPAGRQSGRARRRCARTSRTADRYRGDVTIGPMVPLTTVATAFEARVLAAHLGAEGIVWELRGNVDGPYPMGPVLVLVAEDELAVAREVVGEQAPADTPLSGGDAPAAARPDRPDRAVWVLLAASLLVVALLLGRLLVLTGH